MIDASEQRSSLLFAHYLDPSRERIIEVGGEVAVTGWATFDAHAILSITFDESDAERSELSADRLDS